MTLCGVLSFFVLLSLLNNISLYIFAYEIKIMWTRKSLKKIPYAASLTYDTTEKSSSILRKTHKEMYEITSSRFLSEVILGRLMSGEIPGRWQLVRREKTLVEKSLGQSSWMWIRPLCAKNINRKLTRNIQFVFKTFLFDDKKGKHIFYF